MRSISFEKKIYDKKFLKLKRKLIPKKDSSASDGEDHGEDYSYNK